MHQQNINRNQKRKSNKRKRRMTTKPVVIERLRPGSKKHSVSSLTGREFVDKQYIPLSIMFALISEAHYSSRLSTHVGGSLSVPSNVLSPVCSSLAASLCLVESTWSIFFPFSRFFLRSTEMLPSQSRSQDFGLIPYLWPWVHGCLQNALSCQVARHGRW